MALKHLLFTPEGEALPRWNEAFPKGMALATGVVGKADADVVWFKLDANESTPVQLDWLKTHYGDKIMVIMTTIPLANEAINALADGARAYVNAYAGPITLKQIAKVIEDGGVWLGEDLMQYLVLALGKANKDTENTAWQKKLSAREVEVVKSIARGGSNKVVARELNISERTVKAHLTAIYEKLGVKDRLMLVLLVTGQS